MSTYFKIANVFTFSKSCVNNDHTFALALSYCDGEGRFTNGCSQCLSMSEVAPPEADLNSNA